MKDTNILIIFYWFLAYTILLAFLITSLIKALTKNKSDIFHFLMILSCSLLMIGTTLIIIIGTENKSLLIILQIISTSGVCLGIYSIPAFALNLSPSEYKKSRNDKILKILVTISIIFFLLSIYNYFARKSVFLFFIVYIFYFLVIGVTSILGVISINKKNENEKDNKFWPLYLKKLGIVSIIFVPIFALIDLFGGFGFNPIVKIYNLGFRFFPLFFVIWSFIYFTQLVKSSPIKILNEIDNSSIELNNFSSNISELALSSREKEVLELLLSGLSYKQIATKLSISMSTVKTHICRIYEKTGTNSKIELMNKILNKSK